LKDRTANDRKLVTFNHPAVYRCLFGLPGEHFCRREYSSIFVRFHIVVTESETEKFSQSGTDRQTDSCTIASKIEACDTVIIRNLNINKLHFTARQHAMQKPSLSYRRDVCLCLCPSVYLFVTLCCSIKMVQFRITKSLLSAI